MWIHLASVRATLLQDLDGAMVAATRAATLAPTAALPLRLRADIYTRAGRYTMAARDYQRLSLLDPADPGPRLLRARCLLREGKVSWLARVVHPSEPRPPTGPTPAACYPQTQMALRCFLDYAQCCPQEEDTFVQRGKALMLLGDWEGAVQAFHSASGANGSALNLCLLAEALVATGDRELGRRVLQASLDGGTGAAGGAALPPSVLVLQGRCLQSLGEFEEGWKRFDWALRTTPGDEDALLGRGMCKNILAARAKIRNERYEGIAAGSQPGAAESDGSAGRGAATGVGGLPGPQGLASGIRVQFDGASDFSLLLRRNPKSVEALLHRGACAGGLGIGG